jgi:flagellar biogenesis protein FliO
VCLTELWRRVLQLRRPAPRRLRLCESLPLGERRFVAVVEFDAARFLLGGTSSSLVLLSRLEESRETAEEPAVDRQQDGGTGIALTGPVRIRPVEK